MTHNTGNWKLLEWDAMVEYAITSQHFTHTFEHILDAVSEQGIGSAEACCHVINLIGQSDYHRERINELIAGIVRYAEFLRGDELIQKILKDLQIIVSVYVIIGTLTGLQATSTIVPDPCKKDGLVQ